MASSVTPVDVYQEVLRQGGSLAQAQVAAALVSGIESNGDPLILSGGKGPAQGLFQFEPSTWTGGAGGGKNGLPSTVAAASWQQQVTGFINDTGGKGGSSFGAWGPDVVAARGDPNSVNNPAYGYSGSVQAGSVVGNVIAKNAAAWASAAPTGPNPTGLTGQAANAVGGAAGAVANAATGGITSGILSFLGVPSINWTIVGGMALAIALVLVGVYIMFHTQINDAAMSAVKTSGEAAAA